MVINMGLQDQVVSLDLFHMEVVEFNSGTRNWWKHEASVPGAKRVYPGEELITKNNAKGLKEITKKALQNFIGKVKSFNFL